MSSAIPSNVSSAFTLADLAGRLSAELRGDPAALITGVAGIEEAAPGDVTFVSNPRYAKLAGTTRATAVLVEPAFPEIAAATLRLANPYLAFARVLELFHRPPAYPPGVHPTAAIAATARIGANAHIGAYAVVSDHVTIGDDAVILPHVVLYPHVTVGDRFFAHAHAVIREHCRLGDDVLLQNGAIVGADGFGFARQFGAGHEGSAWHKILQSGPAVLEDNVEVQANACIDRATIGETRIGTGTKIDNLVQVGHGSVVGKDTLLCAQVGLAGSSTVGSNVILAGQVGVVGHSVIGDGVTVTAQSGVPGDVPAGTTISGSPAFESRQWMRSVALFNRLPEIVRELRAKTKA
jgi:UDP-3-O-[3-hydroxymyristoyl] glucosamine N-acyltransferase